MMASAMSAWTTRMVVSARRISMIEGVMSGAEGIAGQGAPVSFRGRPAIPSALVLFAPPIWRYVSLAPHLLHGGLAARLLLGHTRAQTLILPQVGQHLQRIPDRVLDLLAVLQQQLHQRLDHPLVPHPAEDLHGQALHVDRPILPPGGPLGQRALP